MRALLSLLPLAGCGAMMVVCMILMSRGSHDKAPSADIEALRAEVAELRAERGAGDAAGEHRA